MKKVEPHEVHGLREVVQRRPLDVYQAPEQPQDFVEDYHDEWYYSSHELLEQCYGHKIANYKTIKGIIL